MCFLLPEYNIPFFFFRWSRYHTKLLRNEKVASVPFVDIQYVTTLTNFGNVCEEKNLHLVNNVGKETYLPTPFYGFRHHALMGGAATGMRPG